MDYKAAFKMAAVIAAMSFFRQQGVVFEEPHRVQSRRAPAAYKRSNSGPWSTAPQKKMDRRLAAWRKGNQPIYSVSHPNQLA